MRLYFGHPIDRYDTDQEDRLLNAIKSRFPVKIVTPGSDHHQRAYDEYKQDHDKGMKYFLNEVLPDCDGGVSSSDSKTTSGVPVIFFFIDVLRNEQAASTGPHRGLFE